MSLFRRKKKDNKVNIDDAFSSVYSQLDSIDSWEDPKKLEHYILDSCEQIVAGTKEIEKQKAEYRIVTTYLNDIKTIDTMATADHDELRECGKRVVDLNKSLEIQKYTVRSITDDQFNIIENEENDMPLIINRMSDSEAMLAQINRQMKELEGKKSHWEIERDSIAEQKLLIKRLSYVVMGSFVAFFLLLTIIGQNVNVDTSFGMLVLFFITTLCGFVIFMYQGKLRKDYRKVTSRLNTVISALNVVRMKYVNILSGVEYTKEKFSIENSAELRFVWEQYIEKVKDNERFVKSNDDLDYFSGKLERLLNKIELHDRKFWYNQVSALVNDADMQVVREKLIKRRQKIRERMEANRKMIKNERDEIDRLMKEHKFYLPEINEIIKSVDKMCGTGPLN